MEHFSNCTVEGFITENSESRTTKTGKTVLTFPLAINHYNKPGEPPRVSFLVVEAWNELALRHTDNLIKGKRVMVSGSLRQDRWEVDNGKMESRIKIIANEIIFKQ